MNPETATLVLQICVYTGFSLSAIMLFLSIRENIKEIKKKKLNTSTMTHRQIYKSIKKIFGGSVRIQFIPEYKEFDNCIPEPIVSVKGKSESSTFFCKRPLHAKQIFQGSNVLYFYLDKNREEIINWINGNTLAIDPKEDFLENFDAYQGEGNIEPTRNRPYEFFDVD